MVNAAALVRQLRSASRLAQLQALRNLALLALDSPEARQAAVAAGAVAAIVQLKGLGSSGTMQQAAACALHVLSKPPDAATLAAFVEAGAIPILVGMLQSGLSSSKSDLRLPATITLCSLATCDGGAAVAAGGGIQPIVELLVAGRGQPIREPDMAAAGVLLTAADAGTKQLAHRVLELGGVPALLALLERRGTAGAADATEEHALVCAAIALSSLAERGEGEAAQVTRAGSVRHLVGLLSHGSAEVQGAAADGLRGLLRYSTSAREAFAELRAAPVVVRLLYSPNRGVQDQAAGVLGNAARDCAANSAAILAAGAVPPLVQLLRTPGHPAHEFAAATVANLCFMQPAAAAAAVEQAGGVMETLGQLAANSDCEQVRETARRVKNAVAYAKQQLGSSGSEQRRVKQL